MHHPANSEFVILRHHVGSTPTRKSVGVDSVHFDWMFLMGDKLRTWSTVVVESLTQDTCMDAVQLPDHRKEYLEIEGDIGRGRGTVSQVARGQFELIEDSDELFQCRIAWVDSASGQQNQQQTIEFYRIRSSDLRGDWRLELGLELGRGRKETN